MKRIIGLSALSLLALSVAQAQRPVAANAGAEKPWPSVGFREVFDVSTYFPGMTKQQTPPDNTNETNDMFSFVTNAGDGSNRIYLVERVGKIWTVQDGKILGDPLLDISTLTNAFQPNGTEGGLLSIAFSPDYKTDHQFYVFYTSAGTAPGTALYDLTIARYSVDPKDPYHAVKGSGEIIFTLAHPNMNHFGGQIAFGKDGMLYLATGDGNGAGNDIANNAQNLGVLLGKMLRFDVKSPPDAGKKYHVPADNPFVNNPNAKPEIWALGLRNPYRFSFDPANGDLYIGNVGQDLYEQVYYQAGTSKGGENYGWSIYEGTHELTMVGGGPVPNKPPQQPGTPNITFPVADFPHPALTRSRAVASLGPTDFRCIIGGYVYRGAEFPGWQGVYFFSDWILGEVWAMRRDADGKWETHEVDGGFGKNPAKGVDTFGTDEKGNLYMTSFGDGKIYKLVEVPPPAA